ncbi:hypothetical protein M0R45_002867 [Rubus argutus]|uniref:Uncharacterized protein n=1 Tax=Rubus argutus TaxID=59490 RepID=A0AAW1VQB2_RUBAR
MEISISVASKLYSEEVTNEADLETGHISEEMTEEKFPNEADLETGHILDEEIIACVSSFSVTVVTKPPGQY